MIRHKIITPLVAAICCAMMLAFVQPARAQAKLGIGFNSASIPDTVHVGDTLHLSFYVKNYNTQSPFSGSFMLNGGLLDSLGLDSLIGVTNYNYFIGAGDSIPYTINFPVILRNNFTNVGFRIGGNVIVVWPSILANSNFMVIDSLVDSLHVLADIHDRPSEGDNNNRSLNIYPIPATSFIQFDMTTSGKTIEQVRLFDLSGRMLLLVSDESMRIDISELQPGLYILEAKMLGIKRPEIYKVQKK